MANLRERWNGDYIGVVSILYSALTGKDFAIRVYNITQAREECYINTPSTTGTTNFANGVLPLYIEATAGDRLVLQIACVTDGTDPIIKAAFFEMHYLHD